MPTIIILDAPADAANALLDRIMRRPATEPTVADAVDTGLPSPFVDAKPGERYAGVVLVEGKPSHHLFLLDAKAPKRMTWQSAKEWAESVGGSLPTRFESALLYANLQSQFDQTQWHWTDTQFSAGSAWSQTFDDGTQGSHGKSHEFLVRAVRRLEI